MGVGKGFKGPQSPDLGPLNGVLLSRGEKGHTKKGQGELPLFGH